MRNLGLAVAFRLEHGFDAADNRGEALQKIEPAATTGAAVEINRSWRAVRVESVGCIVES